MKTKKDDYQLACIDFETNGLTLNDDSLSISIRLLNKDGTPTLVEFYSLTYSDQKLNPHAIAVNGLSEEQIRNAPKAKKVVENFITWLTLIGQKNKLISPMGHNFISYDEPRLKKLLGEKYSEFFHYHSDDSMVLARALRRAGLLKVSSCSLDVLSEYFKITNPWPHNASGDTWTTGMVYANLLKILQPNLITRIIRVFNPSYIKVK